MKKMVLTLAALFLAGGPAKAGFGKCSGILEGSAAAKEAPYMYVLERKNGDRGSVGNAILVAPRGLLTARDCLLLGENKLASPSDVSLSKGHNHPLALKITKIVPLVSSGGSLCLLFIDKDINAQKDDLAKLGVLSRPQGEALGARLSKEKQRDVKEILEAIGPIERPCSFESLGLISFGVGGELEKEEPCVGYTLRRIPPVEGVACLENGKIKFASSSMGTALFDLGGGILNEKGEIVGVVCGWEGPGMQASDDFWEKFLKNRGLRGREKEKKNKEAASETAEFLKNSVSWERVKWDAPRKKWEGLDGIAPFVTCVIPFKEALLKEIRALIQGNRKGETTPPKKPRLA